MSNKRKLKTSQRPGPDPTEKLLEDYEDVFADIINVLLYQGRPVVKPENLRDGPTASMYKAAEGRVNQKNRDILKFDTEHGVEIRVYGLENQTKSSNVMPVRIMGYDFSSYDRNIRKEKAKNKRLKREADYAAELWPDQKLCPVITLVLYFGTEPWSGPTSLHDMLDLPDELKEYVPDYRINLVQVAFLPDETIAQFQSDFQIVAEFFKAKRLGNSNQLRYNQKKWNHVAELLDFFQTFTGQKKYEKIKQEVIERSKKEEIVMDPIFDTVWKEGLEEGLEKGLEKGREEATRTGITALIETCQEFNHTKDELLTKLMEKFNLTRDQATGYIQQYWI